MNEVAANYGQALFSLAKDNDSIVEWQKEVRLLQDIIKENPDILVLLSSSFRSLKDRLLTVDEILKDFSKDIKNYIKVMVEHNQIHNLLLSLQQCNSLCNEYRGIKEGLLFSVTTLDKETKKRIEQKIGELEHADIELIEKIDSTLIGGVKVVIGNHVYDGSVKNQLEQLHLNLLKEENSHEN